MVASRVRRALLAVAVISTAGSARAQTIPPRIVSTSPSITETLFGLGLGDRVVGVSTYCRYPERVTQLPKVGTFLKPNAEAIARLRPDLVFVHAGPNAVPSQLASLGIRTASVTRGGLASVFMTIREIAAAAGVSARGDSLVRHIDRELDRVRASVSRDAKPKVLILVGRRVGTLTDLIAVGPGSYLSDVAAIAGATNVMSDVKLEYPRISMETVIKLAPDIIIDAGEMGESRDTWDRRRVVTQGLWKEQTLVRSRVHVVHDEAFVVPGPRIVDLATMMAALFHPGRGQ